MLSRENMVLCGWMLTVFLYVTVLLSITDSIPVNVTSNIELENHSGRYTQIKLGIDNLPLMVYNNEDCGCVGVVHCQNILCSNLTINHMDKTNNGNNARFIYMKMSPITGLPQLSYAEQASSSKDPSLLKFVTCQTLNCSQFNVNQVYSSSSTPPAYSMFSYDINNNPLITVTLDNQGLAVIQCQDVQCSKYSEPKIVAKGSQNGKYPSIITIVDKSSSDTLYSIFVYYNEDAKDLEYTIMNMNTNEMNSGIIDKSNNNNDLGKYSFAILSVNQTLSNVFVISVMYTDQTNGDLKYANCNVSYSEMKLNCRNRVVDNIGIGAYGVFPEMDVYSEFQSYPILSYFNSTSNDSGAIKFMECNDISCSNPYIKVLSIGKAGYGRDSSIAYYKGDSKTSQQQMLWVSFLDYNQDGKDKKARLLVVEAV